VDVFASWDAAGRADAALFKDEQVVHRSWVASVAAVLDGRGKTSCETSDEPPELAATERLAGPASVCAVVRRI